MRKEKDFVSSTYAFEDDNCNPKHNVKVSLSKQKDEDDSYESFWVTVWGEWGDKSVSQLDLTFESKRECVKFLNDLIAVVKSDYKK